jgi:hypothetical protein
MAAKALLVEVYVETLGQPFEQLLVCTGGLA